MSPTHIVIADDHAAFQTQCRALLETKFDVLAVVGDGEAAVEAVTRHDPDILVLDVGMPGLNGIGVLARLGQRGARARVVVLTQQQDRGVAAAVQGAGGAAFVTKARMARDLEPAIAAALEGAWFCSPLPGGAVRPSE